MPVCPKCLKAREPREKIVAKNKKHWLIESCRICDYHFDITEWKMKKTAKDA